MRADATAWAMLLLLGLIWGGSFTTVGFAVSELPPLTVAAARLAVGALLLLGLAYALGPGLPDRLTAAGRRIWAHAAGAAIAANALPFCLLSWAQTHVSSGLAGILMAILPLAMLPMAAAFVPGERMTFGRSLGLALGFVGVVVLIGPEALVDLGRGDAIEVLAQVACLAAALGYGVGSIVSKRSPPCHPLSFAAAAVGLAALTTAPLALLAEAPFAADWTAEAALAVIALGAIPTALAMVVLLKLLARTGPSFVSLVNYQVPLWAMLFGIALLGEEAPARALPALALIFGGLALAQGAPRRAFDALRRLA